MSLHSKLAEVMAEIGHVPKRGRNTFHNYDYVLESDLVDAVRTKLAAKKVMLYMSVEDSHSETIQFGKEPQLLTTVYVEFTLADGESDETFKFRGTGCGADKGDKGIYKALTGAMKYGLMKLFLVPTGDDPEADSSVDKRTKSGGGAVSTAAPPAAQAPKSSSTAAPPSSPPAASGGPKSEEAKGVRGSAPAASSSSKTPKGQTEDLQDKAKAIPLRGELKRLSTQLGQNYPDNIEALNAAQLEEKVTLLKRELNAQVVGQLPNQ